MQKSRPAASKSRHKRQNAKKPVFSAKNPFTRWKAKKPGKRVKTRSVVTLHRV
jgi:hypothetical protein